jgi:hypothetical protein
MFESLIAHLSDVAINYSGQHSDDTTDAKSVIEIIPTSDTVSR